jgi:hypothetical protein
MKYGLSLLLLLGVACRAKEEAPPPAVSVAPTVAPSPATSTTAGAPPSDTTAYMATMFARLGSERENRPTETPTVEAVMAALRADGFVLEAGRQVLGAMVGARYCWQTGTTDRALGMAICEYESAAGASAGKERALGEGAAFGDRTVVVTGKTTVMLKGPAEQVKKASAVVGKL